MLSGIVRAVTVAGMALLPISGSSAAPSGLLDFPSEGVRLKNGWSTFAAKKTSGVCIEADEDSAPGDHTFFTYREISDQDSLSSSLSSSVSAKVQMAVGSGRGSISFSRDQSLSTTGLNIAVQYLILHGPSFIVPKGSALGQMAPQAASDISSFLRAANTEIKLLPNYVRLARDNPLEFRRICGDSFVSGISYSSGIEGVLVASTRTESERASVSGSFNASYFTGSGEGNVTSTTTKLASENRLNLTYHKIGAPGLPGTTSAQEFRELIKAVGNTATRESSTPTHIFLTPYDELSNYPSATESASTLHDIAAQYLRLLTVYRYVSDATTRPDAYIHEGKVTRDSVVKLEGEVLSDIKSLQAALVECGRNPGRGNQVKPVCVFPDVAKTDWAYRSRMPLSKDAAYAYDTVQALTAQIPIWANERGPVQRDRYQCRSFPEKFCYRDNPQWAEAQAKIDAANKFISENPGTVHHEAQRFQVFIANPRQLRCGRLELDVCISAEEAEQIRAQM